MIRADADDLQEAIGAVYEAAMAPGQWPDAVAKIVALTHLGVGNLWVVDEATKQSRFYVLVGTDPVYYTHFLDYFWATVPAEYWHRRPIGEVVRGQELPYASGYERSEFYNDWVLPQGLHGGVTATIGYDFGAAARICMFNAGHGPDFDVEDKKVVERLLPHLRRSLLLQNHLDSLQWGRDLLAEAMDRFPVGVVLLGERGEVIGRNRAAMEIDADRDGFTIGLDGLRGANAAATAALRKAIASAIAGAGDDSASDGLLSLPRPSLRRSYNVLICPLRGHIPQVGVRHSAAVAVVSDPEREIALPTDRLIRLYGLTPAEAALAVQLVAGRTLEEIAEERCVSWHTIRTQIKQVFAKTDTRRQSELVRLVLTSSATLR